MENKEDVSKVDITKNEDAVLSTAQNDIHENGSKMDRKNVTPEDDYEKKHEVPFDEREGDGANPHSPREVSPHTIPDDAPGHPQAKVEKRRPSLLRIHDISKSERISRENEKEALIHSADGLTVSIKVRDCESERERERT